MTQLADNPNAVAAPSIGGYTAKRLAEAVRLSDERLATFRKMRRGYVKQYAGPDYGYAASDLQRRSPEPINGFFSMAATYVPQLVMQCPQADIGSKQQRAAGAAAVLGGRWNQLARAIRFGSTLRRVVTDSLWGMGIIKTGVCSGRLPAEGVLHDVMQPFADPVDLDDYVIDPVARYKEQAGFEGSRFRLPKAQALASGMYDEAQLNRIAPCKMAEGRVSELSAQRAGEMAAELAELIELVELWLPGEGVLVTLDPASGDSGKFLSEVPYQGPESGPYDLLGYHWVPGNVLPTPIAGQLFDLHVMINKVARKLGRQADRQKNLLLFDQTVGDEAKQVKNAMDGDMLGVQNADRYKEVSFGGGNEKGYEHFGFLISQFSRIAGNLDLMSGMSAQSDTATQDQLLQANADIRLRDMKAQVVEFVQAVGDKLAWYLWNIPVATDAAPSERLPQVVPVLLPNGVQVDYPWDPSQWQELGLAYEDMDFRIEPSSMVPMSPEQKYRRLVEWVAEIVLPTAPVGAAQGSMLNVPLLTALTGQLAGVERVPELYLTAPAQEVTPVQQPARQGGGVKQTQNVSVRQGAQQKPAQKPQGQPQGATP